MNLSKTDIIVVMLCYLIVFSIVCYYNLAHVLVNDGVKEYQEYLLNLSNGWEFRNTLINSCLFTTLLPVYIVNITNWDPYWVFRILPAFFYPLMAVFVYLIARRYLTTKYALVAVAVVVTNSHILYFPDIGRVGIAIAFLAGMLWALLEKRLIWAIIFSTLLVFTHYGTSLVAVVIIGFVFLGLLIWNKKFDKQYVIIGSLLVVLIGVWIFGLAGYSGKIMTQTLFQTDNYLSSTDEDPSRTGKDIDQTGKDIDQTEKGLSITINPDLLDITKREAAVQDALGIDISNKVLPKQLEIVSNWIVVLLITLGLLILIRSRTIDKPFKLMVIGLYGLILCTISIPWLSIHYGAMRVYFTSLVVIASCFPLGAKWLADKAKINPFVIIIPILIFYALSTSGLIYRPFGLAKYFTVVYTLS